VAPTRRKIPAEEKVPIFRLLCKVCMAPPTLYLYKDKSPPKCAGRICLLLPFFLATVLTYMTNRSLGPERQLQKSLHSNEMSFFTNRSGVALWSLGTSRATETE